MVKYHSSINPKGVEQDEASNFKIHSFLSKIYSQPLGALTGIYND